MHLFAFVLHMLKKCVSFSKERTPNSQIIQGTGTTKFLALFVKPEVLQNKLMTEILNLRFEK